MTPPPGRPSSYMTPRFRQPAAAGSKHAGSPQARPLTAPAQASAPRSTAPRTRSRSRSPNGSAGKPSTEAFRDLLEHVLRQAGDRDNALERLPHQLGALGFEPP